MQTKLESQKGRSRMGKTMDDAEEECGLVVDVESWVWLRQRGVDVTLWVKAELEEVES